MFLSKARRSRRSDGLAVLHGAGAVGRRRSGLAIGYLQSGRDVVSDARGRCSFQRLVDPGDLMGSPYYMAPEQWADDDPDSRSDIYSLGVMLYQMLAGDVPFKGSSIPAI